MWIFSNWKRGLLLKEVYRKREKNLSFSYSLFQKKRVIEFLHSFIISDNKLKNILENALTSMNFSIANQGILNLKAKIKIEKSDLENRYFNVRWFLTIKILFFIR